MDIFNLQNNNLNNQVFLTNGSTNWQIWQKPRNCKFVFIFILGGGGGGGSGAASASLNPTISGGGGGGCSAVTRAFFPSNLIPDTLYVQVGVGGVGGTPNTSTGDGNPGGSGGLSYVCLLPSGTTSNILIGSGSVAAGGGLGGTTTNVAGGSGGQAFLRTLGSSSGYLNYLGNYNSATSQNGGTGNLLAGQTVSIAFPVTSGGGGGGITTGTQYPGGSILTAPGDVSGTTGGVIGGGNGNNGPTYELPSLNSMSQNRVYFIGGAGGGASYFETSGVATGGNGGNGSYGCGGGGGGAIGKGTIGRTSGAGGRGGDGLVIINCW
jgi:hypothetical protein